jgi:hypothetical protein
VNSGAQKPLAGLAMISAPAKGVAIVETYQIPTAARRVHTTYSDLCRQQGNEDAAEIHRARAEAVILSLADSFAPDESLRQSFLSSTPVRSILSARAERRDARPPRARHPSARQRDRGSRSANPAS